MTISDPRDIISKTTNIKTELSNAMLDLNSSCISFVDEYDEYIAATLYDATKLKNRMKLAVMKAVPDDI